MEEYAVRSAIKRNLIPIIDATNLNPKTIKKWENLAKKLKCEIEYKKFYVPFKEALERDSKRERAVGKKVLINFYTKYFYDKYVKEVGYDDRKIEMYDENVFGPCIILDLDGTVFLHQNRLPYDWDKINTDQIDPRLHRLIKEYIDKDVTLLFVTGRPESARKETEAQIEKYFGDCYYELLMRSNGDNRSGDIVKKELFEGAILNDFTPLCVFEDSNKCVEMWRDLGLLTCQVANGDY